MVFYTIYIHSLCIEQRKPHNYKSNTRTHSDTHSLWIQVLLLYTHTHTHLYIHRGNILYGGGGRRSATSSFSMTEGMKGKKGISLRKTEIPAFSSIIQPIFTHWLKQCLISNKFCLKRKNKKKREKERIRIKKEE